MKVGLWTVIVKSIEPITNGLTEDVIEIVIFINEAFQSNDSKL